MSEAGLRVCLIEDDALVRDAAAFALEDRGYNVVVAVNGAQGLAEIERQLPDVVVTDVVMPGHDALEFLPRLRARFPHLPVVVVSGGGQTGTGLYLDLARKLGADECLSKPFTPQALADAIERAFRRNAE